jgi:hypothetical protein
MPLALTTASPRWGIFLAKPQLLRSGPSVPHRLCTEFHLEAQRLSSRRAISYFDSRGDLHHRKRWNPEPNHCTLRDPKTDKENVDE